MGDELPRFDAEVEVAGGKGSPFSGEGWRRGLVKSALQLDGFEVGEVFWFGFAPSAAANERRIGLHVLEQLRQRQCLRVSCQLTTSMV